LFVAGRLLAVSFIVGMSVIIIIIIIILKEIVSKQQNTVAIGVKCNTDIYNTAVFRYRYTTHH